MATPLFFLILLLNAISATALPEKPPAPEQAVSRPLNIILMIGDGMGISQISAGMYANGNASNLERFPVAGLQKTRSGSSLFTDTAAAATAMACGVKTYNGGIGVDVDSLPVLSILEEAEMRDMATGLITTSSLTHATTAAFIAHAKSAGQTEEIADAFLETEVDLMIGGGERAFAQRATDGRNLKQELEKKGYFVSDFREQPLSDIVPMAQRNFAYFTADEEPPTASEGRDYLPKASSTAAYLLSQRGEENGFFLMINGAQIDRGGQLNDEAYVVSEMLDFDRAAGEVMRFAERDGQTLVIVTASHETGGHAINPGSRMDSLITRFTTTQPTASLVPVFAYGPQAELFRGVYDNTAIYTKMRSALGWESRP